ncbi:MAG: carboxypeptidase regulatory-like domain-containing protein [Gemmatimonadales bacterium]
MAPRRSRGRWRRTLITLALASGVGAGPAAAQGDAGTIRGVAFDSLLQAGLPGAAVWVRGTGRTATTDSAGGFRVDSVPAGRHVLALAHADLDSAGLYSVAAAVTVEAGDTAVVALTVPSLRTLWRRACPSPDAAPPDSGILFGVVRDARTGNRIAGAAILITWLSLQRVGRAQVMVDTREARVLSDSIGGYYACGVGADMRLEVRAYVPTDSSGPIQVLPRARPLARRDLTVGGGTRSAGVRGTVSGPDGRPVANARVAVEEAGSTTSGEDGRFALGGLPAGTQWLRVRAIGHTPFERAVDLRDGDTTALPVVLARAPVLLDSIAVRGIRPLALEQFEERRRLGMGYALGEEELRRRPTVRSVFASFPSVTVAGRSATNFVILMPARGTARGRCTPNIYIDGLRSSVEGLGAYRPEDMVGVEVYTRGSDAPGRYQPIDTECGVVLVWTKYLR